MSAKIKEMVKKQIQFSLSQLANPNEQLEVLKELIPGAVEFRESYELTKIRIEAKLDKKARWKLPNRSKKSTKKQSNENQKL